MPPRLFNREKNAENPQGKQKKKRKEQLLFIYSNAVLKIENDGKLKDTIHLIITWLANQQKLERM